MQIQTTRTERVRDILDRISARYGDLEGALAAAKDDPRAMDAVYWFKEVRDDRGIMEEEVTTTVLAEVDPADVAKLTPTRLALLEAIRRLGHANIREIQRATGRGYRRVHEDVVILEQIGAVQSHRHGQERIVEATATELVISLAA